MPCDSMKCAIVFGGTGPIVIVTCCNSLEDPGLLRRLSEKGIQKFIAFELPVDSARRHYGNHFNVVCHDLTETDELRVLDYDGKRALSLFDFEEFGPPIFHEPAQREVAV